MAREYVAENYSEHFRRVDVGELDEENAQISAAIERTCMLPLTRARELDLYFEGEEFYAALLEDVAAARNHVHLEFFIWGSDRIGTRLRDALVEKAKEGVEVRIIVDAVGSKKFGRRFRKPLLRAGAEVEYFNRGKLPSLKPPVFSKPVV